LSDIAKRDLYLELGVEPLSTPAEIMSRLEEERERSNLLKKIPKRRSEAEGNLVRIAEIERVLLNPSKRAAYDAGLQSGEPSPRLVAERMSTPAAIPEHEKVRFCTSCGAGLPEDASFCVECIPDLVPLPTVGGTTGSAEEVGTNRTSYSTATALPRPSPFIYMFPILLLVVLVVWFFSRKPVSSVVGPPGPSQVMDLRPTGNAEVQPLADSPRNSDPNRSESDDLEQTVKRDTKAARKLNTQGLRALAGVQPNLVEARRLFQKAVQLDPENVELLNNLGDVVGRLEDYKAAEAILAKVLTMAPKRRVANGNMGYVEAKLGNIDRAEVYFCEYIRTSDSFERGEAKLKGSFGDPDPRVQNAVRLTIANCQP
jgi:hypothetical protein